jgi:CubicO group peptidase (beta-lactamase class C family)
MGRESSDGEAKMMRSGRHAIIAALALWALALPGCGAFRARLPRDIGIPRAQPEAQDATGLSSFWTWTMDTVLDLNVAIGAHSGYVAMFAREGQVVHVKTAGYADIEQEEPMQIDTRFRLASLTKPVTATAAFLLIEDGRLDLEDPVERYVPAAGQLRVATSHQFGEDGTIPTVPLARPLTVRDLLSFRAGIGSEEDPSDLGRLWAERNIYAGKGSLEERVNRILTAPLYEQPGQVWRYGWSADVLARVIEVAAGEPLDQFVERRILAPLGMTSTEYLSPEIDHADMASLYTQDPKRDLIRVDMHERDALDWTPGGSGLVSTAPDMMRFALMLWNGGIYDGERILSQESVELMSTPQVFSGVLEDQDIEGLGWGLGVAIAVDASATPMVDRDGDFWWSGLYGTTFFVSPETDLVGVVLSQNEPSPYSRLPYAVYIAPAFAYFGL